MSEKLGGFAILPNRLQLCITKGCCAATNAPAGSLVPSALPGVIIS
ncbi:hypothetical protein M1247_22755 [Mycobacterium sp. 21AC1]|nr:hypothetical protein [Mycobacterium sp. 21AC1]MDV3127755.1 hypothetical protein [Mycobacterium sp. 21AC1]